MPFLGYIYSMKSKKRKYRKDVEGLEGLRVRVYRNLNQKCFSVRCMKTNRVIAHVQKIFLENITFPVSETQRQKVLESKQKNVHAFIQGFISKPKRIKKETRISYDPYRHPFFFKVSSETEVGSANFCDINIDKGIYVI